MKARIATEALSGTCSSVDCSICTPVDRFGQLDKSLRYAEPFLVWPRTTKTLFGANLPIHKQPGGTLCQILQQ